MTLKLFSFPGDKNSYKGLVAAQYAGVAVELAKDFKMGVTNKEAAFLQKNPHGKVPVLQAEGGCVFESNAIARYIARLSDCGLFGATLIDHGHVEQWIDFASNEIDAPLSSWVLPDGVSGAFGMLFGALGAPLGPSLGPSGPQKGPNAGLC